MSSASPFSPHAVVIGGGPAGLMAAEVLAGAGWRVDLHERMPTLARKFLMAGRGGLNLTHSEPTERFLDRYGDPAGLVRKAVIAFPPERLQHWAESLGETTFVGSSGRVFPRAMKASPLLRAWLRRLDGMGVRFHLRSRWTGWDAGGRLRFEDATGVTHETAPDATILALGGASWPRLGSDGAWVPVLQATGIALRSFEPANCGFAVGWSETFRNRFAGAPVKRVAIALAGEDFAHRVEDFARRVEGEAVITASGVEGGAIYALNREIRARLRMQPEPVEIRLDLRPNVDVATLAASLGRMRKGDSLSNGLRKAGLAPVAIGLMREALGRALPTDADALATAIKSLPLRLLSPEPIARAISSDGGVMADAVDEALMLRARPGVFVAGEMLDWDAPTGGYLLQASFATAVMAAEGAIARQAAIGDRAGQT